MRPQPAARRHHRPPDRERRTVANMLRDAMAVILNSGSSSRNRTVTTGATSIGGPTRSSGCDPVGVGSDRVGDRTSEAARLQGERCNSDNGGGPKWTAFEPSRGYCPPLRGVPKTTLVQVLFYTMIIVTS